MTDNLSDCSSGHSDFSHGTNVTTNTAFTDFTTATVDTVTTQVDGTKKKRVRKPLIELERYFDGCSFDETFIGLDESGLGSLAFPVVAAAVIWPTDFEHDMIKQIRDSKKISEKKRIILSDFIKKHAIDYGIGFIDNERVDEINILKANMEAMHLALDQINTKFDCILIDGNNFKSYKSKTGFTYPHYCEPKADNKYIAVAAASILAKVARDQYIEDIVMENPELEKYGFLKNKAYGSLEHRNAIVEHGPTKWHRKTFKCVKEYC
jgi:ribonuclease HII